MTVLFPKWTNKLPAYLALGAAATGLCVVFIVYFWFSPKNTDVGYQPYQPIAYSHKLHAGELGIDCRYCHRNVEDAAHASIPDTATCIGCHGLNNGRIKKDSVKLAKLFEAWGDGVGDGVPLEWNKVHLLPQYAYFDHSVHIRANVGCKSCHGRIDQMEIVAQAKPLSMSWCLDCHRDPAPHIRPLDISVTDMEWDPTESSIAAARLHLDWLGDEAPALNPPEHCSACHR